MWKCSVPRILSWQYGWYTNKEFYVLNNFMQAKTVFSFLDWLFSSQKSFLIPEVILYKLGEFSHVRTYYLQTKKIVFSCLNWLHLSKKDFLMLLNWQGTCGNILIDKAYFRRKECWDQFSSKNMGITAGVLEKRLMWCEKMQIWKCWHNFSRQNKQITAIKAGWHNLNLSIKISHYTQN